MASLKPPFTPQTAHEKVKAAQNLWNTRDPARVALAYTPDCIWRNRSDFLRGHDEIRAFLTRKWAREHDYRLRKELFCVGGGGGGTGATASAGADTSATPDTDGTGNSEQARRIAVQFWYEYRDAEDGWKWKRCYGIEHWTFNAEGKMEKRMMSGNDVEIGEEGRWFRDGVDVDTVVIGERHF